MGQISHVLYAHRRTKERVKQTKRTDESYFVKTKKDKSEKQLQQIGCKGRHCRHKMPND